MNADRFMTALDRRTPARWVQFLVAGLLAVPFTTALAADGPTESKSGAVKTAASTKLPSADAPGATAASVATRLKELEAATDADLPERAELLELYQQALEDLKRAEEQKSRTAELESKRIAAPYLLEIRKREAAAPPTAQPNLPSDGSLSAWEELVTAAEQELEAVQKSLESKEDEPQQRTARRLEIPQAIAAVRIKLDELDQSHPAAAADEEAPSLATARRFVRQARQRVLQSEIAQLEKELQSFDNVSLELLKLDIDKAASSVAAIEKRVAAWRDSVNDRRRREADQEASEAHWAAAKAEPAVRQLAEENSALAEARQELTKTIEELADERETIEARLEKLRDQRKQVTERVKAAGLTDAIGQMLRRQRGELAAIDADRRAIRQRQQEIARVQLELFDFQEQLAGLRDLDGRIQELLTKLPAGSEAKPEDLRSLLKTKRKYLNAMVKDENSYFTGLVDLDSNQRELLNEAEAYRQYIDEHVLWIRSTHSLAPGDAAKAAEAATWLARPANWWQAARALGSDIGHHPLLALLGLLVFVPWLLSQRSLRNKLRVWADPTQTPGQPAASSAAGRALRTTMATLFIAAFWPAVLWFLGRMMAGGATAQEEFAASLGVALQVAAGVMLPLSAARQICRREGLAQVHFGWPADAVAALRRQLTGLMVPGIPLVAIVALLESQTNEAWKNSLGRLTFIASQLWLAQFVFFALRPPSGPVHRLMMLRPGRWKQRLARPMFLLLTALPVALSGLAAAGYYYTALRLTSCLQATVWLVLALIVAQALAARWLMAVYRRLAIEAAVRNAEGAGNAQRSLPHPGLLTQNEEDGDAASEIDLEKVDLQTHRLLHSTAVLGLVVGLFLVWVDVFPALQFFKDVTLWTDAELKNSVSLANLLEAAAVAIMTVVAAANLPSLIEIALLQRLPLDTGVRYAMTTVVRYLIVIVGLALSGRAVGIGWPKLQWLLAAISFGLGFGLQEIFANFVSGLIVLLERPIRIGDTVTVGAVTGVVSRIQMRATTIVDGDRKELIVPNKEFITSQLVNWTLSDSVIRVVVPLGLAYGADTQQVQRLLLRVAAETPTILKDPPAKAVFMGFGEKTLNFELRVFVGSVDALMSTRHQVNMAIDRAFRAAGIDIAFPQRDNHTRSPSATEPIAAVPTAQRELRPKAA